MTEQGEVVLNMNEGDCDTSSCGADGVIRISDDDVNGETCETNLGDEIPKSIYFGGCCWG